MITSLVLHQANWVLPLLAQRERQINRQQLRKMTTGRLLTQKELTVVRFDVILASDIVWSYVIAQECNEARCVVIAGWPLSLSFLSRVLLSFPSRTQINFTVAIDFTASNGEWWSLQRFRVNVCAGVGGGENRLPCSLIAACSILKSIRRNTQTSMQSKHAVAASAAEQISSRPRQ